MTRIISHSLRQLKVRFFTVLSSLFYLASLYFSYDQYLYPNWEYFGFTYRPWGILEVVFAIGLVSFGAILLPIRLNKTSSIVIVSLYVVAYVPGVVVTLCQDTTRLTSYGGILFSLGLGFIIVCWSTRGNYSFTVHGFNLSWARVRAVVLIAWALCVVILLYYYGSTMKFVGFEHIYDQRFAGKDVSAPGLAYIRSLFINVICSFCMSYGLIGRKWGWFLLGAIGCMLTYAIAAAKFAFILPFFYIGMSYILNHSFFWKRWSLFVTLLFGVFVFIATFMYAQSYNWRVFASLLVCRTLAIPGLSVSQYYDLFSVDGFTWWSHVKGLSLFIPIPESFQGDPRWPSLGLIVGTRVFDADYLNANANIWSGDGVAAAGELGLIVISIVLSFWLRLLDSASYKWNSRMVILLVFPYSIALTNAHFFTGLLSFGGLAWFLIFLFISPDRGWPDEFRNKK